MFGRSGAPRGILWVSWRRLAGHYVRLPGCLHFTIIKPCLKPATGPYLQQSYATDIARRKLRGYQGFWLSSKLPCVHANILTVRRNQASLSSVRSPRRPNRHQAAPRKTKLSPMSPLWIFTEKLGSPSSSPFSIVGRTRKGRNPLYCTVAVSGGPEAPIKSFDACLFRSNSGMGSAA